ncbi:hypothetical protein [Flavobacterium sp. LAR06]|uniref:hypothetical protein n=1 Tax=Flavobacterium sp. LAR06 TaxID=3064897 RepID=UPI0035C1D3EA
MREGIYGYYTYQRSFLFQCHKCCCSFGKSDKAGPDSAEALAMLAGLYLNGILLAINTVGMPFEAGFRYSVEALKIDTFSQHT